MCQRVQKTDGVVDANGRAKFSGTVKPSILRGADRDMRVAGEIEEDLQAVSESQAPDVRAAPVVI